MTEKRKGQENLIPMNKRTKEEQREIAKKGAAASIEKRKKAKTFKALLEVMLEEVDPKTGKTNRELMNEAMLQQAIKKGNVKAYEVLRDTAGETVKTTQNIDLKTDNPLKNISTEELQKMINKMLK